MTRATSTIETMTDEWAKVELFRDGLSAEETERAWLDRALESEQEALDFIRRIAGGDVADPETAAVDFLNSREDVHEWWMRRWKASLTVAEHQAHLRG